MKRRIIAVAIAGVIAFGSIPFAFNVTQSSASVACHGDGSC